jgi:hypothetical protein
MQRFPRESMIAGKLNMLRFPWEFIAGNKDMLRFPCESIAGKVNMQCFYGNLLVEAEYVTLYIAFYICANM